MAAASSASGSKGASAAVYDIGPISFPMRTSDPFLFAVYHKDMYPAGDEKMQAPRRGDGADFNPSAPYRMYHGERIPGFPQHPHRGFETITYVMEGTVDHTDSLGSAGRYGDGDMQFMTAGAGCVHGEMFPLVHKDKPNTLRLMQLWLNLPARGKMAPPGYKMFWAERMVKVPGTAGAEATVVVGRLGDAVSAGDAPEHSWARDPEHDVGVFWIALPPGGSSFTLPPAAGGASTKRSLHLVEAGRSSVAIGGQRMPGPVQMLARGDAEVKIVNGDPEAEAQVLVLQGKPIGEPVAQRGPFVMNTEAEIAQAFRDYRATQFGGWPWDEDAVVFPRSQGRFAQHIVRDADGSKRKVTEHPPGSADAAIASRGGAASAASESAGASASGGAGAAAKEEL